MYSYGPPHMAAQKQDDQLELTYSNYVRTQDVTLKTCRRRWMIGRSGERGSGISVLAARHDDDIVLKLSHNPHDHISLPTQCLFYYWPWFRPMQYLFSIGPCSHTCIACFPVVTLLILSMAGCRVVGFYGISTFVGYLTPNPFLCK